MVKTRSVLVCNKIRNNCLTIPIHAPHERCNVRSVGAPGGGDMHTYLYGKHGQSMISNPYVANNTFIRQGDLGSGNIEIYSQKRRARGQPTADHHKLVQRAKIYNQIMAEASYNGEDDGRHRHEAHPHIDARNPGISFVPYQESLSWQQAARKGKFL